MNRRGFLRLAAVAAGGAVVGSAGGCSIAPGEPGTVLRSAVPLPRPYQVPLPTPPVLSPVRTDATTDYYEITQRAATAEILPGLHTPLWTYEGTFPGPTLVSRSGRRTVVRHTNTLPHPVVVHLHGGHTPHDSDGYPSDLVHPHAARTYDYPLDQRAATLWYHDHRMGFTGQSVWYGLAGFHLLHDDEDDALPLPRGDRDLPLMITDRAFDASGAMPYPSVDPAKPGVTEPYMNGVLGDVILVNGAPWPVARVARVRHRLRLLNASNARRYRLELDPPPAGGGGFVQIGGDGGLLDRPRTHDALVLASAERADVVVDFARYAPGTRVRLRNTLGAGSTEDVLAFDVGPRGAADDTRVPARLSDLPRLNPEDATVTRDFLFQNSGDDGWTINGQPYDPAHPLATPRRGQLERWRFITDVHHPVHVHLNHFQVLTRDGEEPGPYDHGWKDTVDLQPAQAVEILVRFTDYAGRYVLHCHNLEHEDMAMMADFVVR